MLTHQGRIQPLVPVPDPAACWECESESAQPVRVRLFAAAVSSPLLLCDDCYRQYYVPLTAELANQLRTASQPA